MRDKVSPVDEMPLMEYYPEVQERDDKIVHDAR